MHLFHLLHGEEIRIHRVPAPVCENHHYKSLLCWLLWPTMPSLPWERSECVLWERLLSGRREWHWHVPVWAGLQWDSL